MSNRVLSLAVVPTAFTQPLLSGDVQPSGLTLDLHGEPIDRTTVSMLGLEYDAAEMALPTFLKAVEDGLPLLGLPLFTSGRRFPFGGMNLSKRSGLNGPGQLKGKVVGMPQYWLGTSVWQRLILELLHGVAVQEVTWLAWQGERLPSMSVPPGVTLRQDSSGRTGVQLMEAGDIDATFTPGGAPPGSEHVAQPAYPDRTAIQRDFFARTGILPLNHLVAIKRDVALHEPETIASLCDAYLRSIAAGKAAATPDEPALEMRDVFGADGWSYLCGISGSRTTLDAALDATFRQGLTARRFSCEEIFAPTLPAELR